MGRVILSVLVGYAAMFAAVFLSFSGLYLALGAGGAFEPSSYRPSVLWTAASFVLGFLAAAAGGWVCARIARTPAGPKALAGLVVVLGLLTAVAVALAPVPAEETRAADVSNLDAMQKARQPVWVAVLNPLVGAVGVLVGGRRTTRN